MLVLASGQVIDGGAEEDRTPDLLRARQALSQLSYGPVVIRSANHLQQFSAKTARFAGSNTGGSGWI